MRPPPKLATFRPGLPGNGGRPRRSSSHRAFENDERRPPMAKSKTTRTRLWTRSIAAAAVLALGTGAAVPALATASGAASTQVTITPENDGFFGLVKSPQLKQCAKDRKVQILKQ